MAVNHFHNTINVRDFELSCSEAQAKSQDKRIHEFFKLRPGQSFTPFDVNRFEFGGRAVITSIRRAMTNLTNAGLLTKTDKQVQGDYGKLNYMWRLYVPGKPSQLNLFK